MAKPWKTAVGGVFSRLPEAIKIKRPDCSEEDPLSIDRQMAGARAAKAAQGAQPGGSGRRSLPALERP